MHLPNFLIIGANKAGTTSIHFYCSQHPQIDMSTVKEPMFFTSTSVRRPSASKEDAALDSPFYVSDIQSYMELFSQEVDYLARGEASTSYLANPDIAIPAIKSFIPDMRIVACLRNPIERAFSSYLMFYRNRLENRTFDQAIEDELSGQSKNLSQAMWYLRLGLYSDSLEKYISAFGRENVLIMQFSELKSQPQAFMQKIFRFLGVDDTFHPNFKVKLNTSEQLFAEDMCPRPMLSEEARSRCADFFREDMCALSKLLLY